MGISKTFPGPPENLEDFSIELLEKVPKELLMDLLKNSQGEHAGKFPQKHPMAVENDYIVTNRTIGEFSGKDF